MKKQMVLFAALMTLFVSNARAEQYVPKPSEDPQMNYVRAQADKVAAGPSCPLARSVSKDLTDEAAPTREAINVPLKPVNNGPIVR